MDRPGAGPRAGQAAPSLALAVVLLSTATVLLFGMVMKQPCAGADWSDGRQYRPPRICYSDIVPLYATEHLQGGRLPFLRSCPAGSGQCDEYPVLTMYFMRLAAWMSDGFGPFFFVNALLLAACAFLAVWLLYRMTGLGALYFALAPTLLIYAFVNWDLLAVGFATAATYAYLRDEDSASGALLGLGAAAKLYPALLIVPFALGRLRQRRSGEATLILVWAVVAYSVVNLPFAVFAPHAWGTFFRFNASRGADWDSLWFVACQRLQGGLGCGWSAHLIDGLSLLVFLGTAVGVWFLRRRVDRDFPAWTFGFPLLVLFLLSNKVYSPQYGLWLLPWFALTLRNPWLFGAFEIADVAVFVTRFTWFGRFGADSGNPAFAGFRGSPLGAFEVAVVIRALVLLVCVVAWTIRRREELPAPLRARGLQAMPQGAAP